MNRTALYNQHIACNAKMVNFLRWLLPLHYGSQIKEHEAVRKKVGAFDISHMAMIYIKGQNATPLLEKLLANDVKKLSPGRALYTCMLNEQGGIKDDMIVYQFDHDHYRLIVNAATTYSDLAWISQYAKAYHVIVSFISMISMIAIQGPHSSQILKALQLPYQIKPFNFIFQDSLLIAKTGYTGEEGFEIVIPDPHGEALWKSLMELGVTPCGLGARDSLRLEAGFNLYGQDMNEETHPYESNLGWTVDLKDPERDFIGREQMIKIKEAGTSKKLVGFTLPSAGILRSGMKIYGANGSELGIVTSGGYSPSLKTSIALARIENTAESQYFVSIRNKRALLNKHSIPFIDKKNTVASV